MFLIVTILYIVSLVLWRPRQISLKEKRPGYWDNVQSVKATLILGISLSFIFWLTSGLEFKETRHGAFGILGISKAGLTEFSAYFQVITRNFIHINLGHLISNLVGLICLSHYERRVGSRRYMMIFFLSGVFSSLLEIPFYGQMVSAGASAGIFGLGAAYFTDYKNLSKRDWLHSILIGTCIGLLFSFPNKPIQDSIQIDYWGHFFGAVSGVILCRLFPIPVTDSETKKRVRLRIATITAISLLMVLSFIPFIKQVSNFIKQSDNCELLYRDEKYQEAFELCSETSGRVAERLVAAMYLNGLGVEKNEKQAFEFFKKSAFHGDARAQLAVGVFYYEGKEVLHNDNLAFRWFKLAALQGDRRAQLLLSKAYVLGQGTEIDYKVAYMWLKLAEKDNDNEIYSAPSITRDLDNEIQQASFFLRAALSDKQIEEATELAKKWKPSSNNAELMALYKGELSPTTENSNNDTLPKSKYSLELAEECLLHYQHKDYKKALEICQKSANVRLQVITALLYNEGLGTEKNPRKALKIIEAMADSSFYGKVGDIYFDGNKENIGENKLEAMRWYQYGAKHGDVTSQMKLAIWSYKGQYGMKQDDVESFKWAEKAANQNHPYAQAMMVVFYGSGKGGVFRDHFQAKYWFKKLVENTKTTHQDTSYTSEDQKEALAFLREYGIIECPKIMLLYADILTNGGWGIPPAFAEGIDIYRKLEKVGYLDAKVRMAVMLYVGKNGHPNKPEALKLFIEAANEGDAFSQRQLGNFYNMGDGVQKDITKSIAWSTKAAENGDPYAQVNLGSIYFYGAGVDRDYTRAYHWLSKAANQNIAQAQTLVSDMYSSGWGVEKDYTKSYMWASLALKQNGRVLDTASIREPVLPNIENALQRKLIDLTAILAKSQLEYAKVLAANWKPSKNANVHLLNNHRFTGDQYFRQNEYAKAGKEYDIAIKENNHDAEAYNNRGLLYKVLKQYDKALTDANKAIELDPYFVSAYNNRGVVYRRMGHLEKAIADYDKSTDISPGNARSYSNRGAVYEQLEKTELVKDTYQEGLVINPEDARLYHNLGGWYFDQDPKNDKVIEQYSNYFKYLTPDELEQWQWHAYFLRAKSYEAQEKYDLALKDYVQAIHCKESKIVTYVYLARAYIRAL
jgi:TPR repeat protein/membrane associated rhomboid family serine protease/Flp pilus assembly protein TadD